MSPEPEPEPKPKSMPDASHIPLIDTHSHLAAPDFDEDRSEVLDRAREAGVVAAVVMGEDYEDNLRVLDVCARHDMLYPAIGHHPWRADRASRDVSRTLSLIEDHRADIVAIGEVGLDYRLAETEEARAEQRAIFRDFIEASKTHDLPLSVHVRSAGHYVIDMLLEHDCPRAVLHAFDGKAKYAIEGAEAGFHFSIPGTVLVSRQKEKLLRAIPLESLLLESDAPALSPDAGMRNEPAVMSRSLERIAELRGVGRDVIAKAAFENTCRVFRLPEWTVD
jgi:TatD DNase family protein